MEGPNTNFEGPWEVLKEFVYLIIFPLLLGTGSYYTVMADLKPLICLFCLPTAEITRETVG